jgi:hypothetical protein
LVVIYGFAHAVFFYRVIGPFGNNIAEIFDFRFFVADIGGYMRRVGDGAASDNGNFHIISKPFLLIH